jgi:lysozyme family protein
MADFDKAFKITLGNEGGYSDDPKDPGGETIFGLARKENPDWDGWPLVDNFKKDAVNFPKNALKDSAIMSRVKLFYKKKYWDVHLLDTVNMQEIGNELFDTGINLGEGKAASFLILALDLLNRGGKDYADVPEDGKIDASDIAVLNAHKRPQNVLKALNGLQFMHYYTITKSKPVFEEYFNGWLNRV